MSRFAVDPDSLMRLAAQVRAAAEEADAVTGARHSLSPAITALRDPSLVSAMHEFVDRWSHSLRSLLDDAHRLADAATLTARIYSDAELGAHSLIGWPSLSRGAP